MLEVVMSSFDSYILGKAYERYEKLGDKLAQIASSIDWEKFRPIVASLFNNRTKMGGRPNIDEKVMLKLLVLQQMYGLSDPELERLVVDRISFQRFLGFPEVVPDYSTVWLFRERLIQSGKWEELWRELQGQLDRKGLKVRKGVIQDATLIAADPGHAPADKPRGDEALTRRSRDGTWVKKGNRSYFGYKLHVKTDVDYSLIREVETTTASTHDSQVDLSEAREVVYRDRGYFGVMPRGFDATMQRGVRGHPLGFVDRLRNRRISGKRAPVERVFAVLKRGFGVGHVMVTTVARVGVRMVFAAFGYNLCQLVTLGRGVLA